MKKVRLRIFSFLLLTAVVFSLLAGCGAAPAVSGSTTPAAASSSAAATSQAASAPVTLTYWVPMTDALAANATDFGQTPMYQEIEKKTGVNIQFTQPAMGQEKEQFNLMVASNNLPDIIEYNWLSDYPGGPTKAIDDKVIIPLNDMFQKNCPNITGILEKRKDIDKLVKTDDKKYYAFPMLHLEDTVGVWAGVQVRKDWLDQDGLAVPETMDEWYTALTKFKEVQKASAPLSFRDQPHFRVTNAFIGAYGIQREFYVDNGKVKFGPYEAAYKDFLTTFRKWYAEKLLDPDFATNDGKILTAKVTTGKTGAFLAGVMGIIAQVTPEMRKTDPKVEIVGTQYPVLKKGDMPKIGQRDFAYDPTQSAAVTTANKNLEATAKLLDFGYGPEGHMIFNFGIENVSYKMENGYPKYTEEITKNPKGLDMTNASGAYFRALSYGPFADDYRYFEQYLSLPEQGDAVKLWSLAGSDTRYPPATPTSDENQQLSSIMNDVNTYVDEMFLKFIMGQASLDTFDDYIKHLKDMKIEDAIAIKQAALERFNNR